MLRVNLDRSYRIRDVQTIMMVGDDLSVVQREFNDACNRRTDNGLLPISEFQLQCLSIPNGRGGASTRWVATQQWADVGPHTAAT